MKSGKINDNKMLIMVDQSFTQVEIAKFFGVSKQAVSKRLQQLRGRTTKAIVAKKLNQVVDDRLDAISQLKKINVQAHELLDKLEDDPGLKIKVMAEIRNQLRLQLDIFETLYSLQAAKQFQ